MAELAPGEDENVSPQLPKTEMEAAALRPVIADLLQSIPLRWTEFDADQLTKLQSQALFLLTAAGMVERRGWIRTTIANHPTCFEIRFQATGESGFNQALEHATAIQFQTWKEAWCDWCNGETKARSPFHAQEMKPQEWQSTDQGELARDELNRARSGADALTVLDFVLKRGLYGPGYWMRRARGAGQPLTAEDRRIIEKHVAAGHDPAQLSRPPVCGSGRLLEIRKVEQTLASQAVTLTNWPEGASAFAEALVKMLGPIFEAMNKAPQVSVPGVETHQPPDPPGAGTSEPTLPRLSVAAIWCFCRIGSLSAASTSVAVREARLDDNCWRCSANKSMGAMWATAEKKSPFR